MFRDVWILSWSTKYLSISLTAKVFRASSIYAMLSCSVGHGKWWHGNILLRHHTSPTETIRQTTTELRVLKHNLAFYLADHIPCYLRTSKNVVFFHSSLSTFYSFHLQSTISFIDILQRNIQLSFTHICNIIWLPIKLFMARCLWGVI